MRWHGRHDHPSIPEDVMEGQQKELPCEDLRRKAASASRTQRSTTKLQRSAKVRHCIGAFLRALVSPLAGPAISAERHRHQPLPELDSCCPGCPANLEALLCRLTGKHVDLQRPIGCTAHDCILGPVGRSEAQQVAGKLSQSARRPNLYDLEASILDGSNSSSTTFNNDDPDD